ncbi:type 4 pilus major pilin [Cysteiniphilum litorale]|uniref:type 4 pilus major pilin n=1 Tax=Cysteiniphilum litorale TaxID=2056700 RepID=UPI003F882CA9
MRIDKLLTKHSKYNKYRKHRNQQGFSLIELSLVLAIIAIIIIGAIILYNSLSGNVKNEDMAKQISMISEGVTKLYRPSGGDYTGLTTQTVINAGFVMPDMLHGAVGAQVIGTSWYGKDNTSVITVAPYNTTQFQVTVTNIPKDNCTTIGAKYLHGNSLGVSANGQAVTTSDTLATACAGTDPATLVLTFY